MKKIFLTTALLLLLTGCEKDDSSSETERPPENIVGETPVGNETLPSNCRTFSKDGYTYQLGVYTDYTGGGSIVKRIGYNPVGSSALILHYDCGPAYEYTDSNGNPWLRNWMKDGQFYRSGGQPSQVSYYHTDNKVYVSEEKWLNTNGYYDRGNSPNYRKFQLSSNSQHALNKEIWIRSGSSKITGQDYNTVYHRDRKKGAAYIDYTWNPETTYDWYENGQLIKHKVINSSTNASYCKYYIENNQYSDPDCVSESQYDSDFGFK